MTNLEYNATLKVLDLIDTKTKKEKNIKDIKIRFDNKFSAIITGNIEKQIIENIFIEYPDLKHSIILNKSSYYIETKEGLLIFLTEILDYNLKNNKTTKNQEQLINIKKEVLKQSKPNISIYEWMRETPEENLKFSSTIEKTQSTQTGIKLRRLLDLLDFSINPFSDKFFRVFDSNKERWLENIDINASVYDANYYPKRENCASIHIEEKNTENNIAIYRNPAGFSYQLHYQIAEEQYITVEHKYSNIGSSIDKGEAIIIQYYGEKQNPKIDIKYNINKSLIQINKTNPSIITEQQIEYIIKQLKDAIGYTKTITLNNLKPTPILKRKTKK